MANVKNLLKISNKKIFFSSFQAFIGSLVDYELKAKGKTPKRFTFFKFFAFWKIFVALWNKLVKSAGLENLALRLNKKTRIFFMTLLALKLSKPEGQKPNFDNLEGHLKFFKRTHLLDLYLFWNLYYYHNVLARFYNTSFLAWAKFLTIATTSSNEKGFLILKRLYGFSDLYKKIGFCKDLNYIFLRYLNLGDLSRFENFIKKESFSFLDAQYGCLNKSIDHSGLIFDRAFPDFVGVYASKEKRYSPFFFTVHYEYDAKGFVGHNRRRFFKKKNMLLSI